MRYACTSILQWRPRTSSTMPTSVTKPISERPWSQRALGRSTRQCSDTHPTPRRPLFLTGGFLCETPRHHPERGGLLQVSSPSPRFSCSPNTAHICSASCRSCSSSRAPFFTCSRMGVTGDTADTVVMANARTRATARKKTLEAAVTRAQRVTITTHKARPGTTGGTDDDQ